ncbi:MAG: TonB family protein [Pseudomonadota bacterium]
MRANAACGLFVFSLGVSGAAQAQDDFAPQSTPSATEVADARVELAVLPTYPKRALRAGIDGEVTVSFTVSRYGRAVDAEVVSAKPRRVFNAAVLDALKYWFIRPARASTCSTIEQTAQQTFRFVHGAEQTVQVAPIVLQGRQTMLRDVDEVDEVGGEGMSAVAGQDQLVVIERVEPEYPDKALNRRREGFVTVSFLIEADGSVSEPRVEAAQNGALFTRAALSAIRRWKFAPTMQNGYAVERLGCHEFLFNLDARKLDEQQRRRREGTRGGAY